jgi:hypothetical protein
MQRSGLMLVIACAILACCSSAVLSVDRELEALRAHLVEGRYEEFVRGLSADQREELEAQELSGALAQDPEMVENLLESMDQALADPSISYSARVVLEDGTEVILLLVDGSWIIQSPVTTFYGQSTPRQALESFIRAFRAERWDVLADLVPSKYSSEDDALVLEKAWSDPAGRETIERILKVVEEHLDDDIEIQGNRATLRYPEGQVSFLREGGRWVILDLD